MVRHFLFAPFITAFLLTAPVQSGDWPQFRYDAGRTAASPHELPAELQLRWTRTLPTPQPAFPHETRLAYDASYEPVVLGRTMFVPSMVTDSVTALDTETGNELWRFMAAGPVRFAPVAWEGKVYFVSDDGYLYCLDADDGSLRWKFRGLPEGRRDRSSWDMAGWSRCGLLGADPFWPREWSTSPPVCGRPRACSSTR